MKKYLYNPNPPKKSLMYDNGDTDLLQYIFEWEPTKTTKKAYPDVGLSR